MSDNTSPVVAEQTQRRAEFEKNSKSASDAMRMIVSALLFPTLAMAYKDNTFHLAQGSPLIYPLFFFCLYFFADLFQFLFRVIAIQGGWDNENSIRHIGFALFYAKFIFGLTGLIYLIIQVIS